MMMMTMILVYAVKLPFAILALVLTASRSGEIGPNSGRRCRRIYKTTNRYLSAI